MLIALIRNKKALTFDYYKEIIMSCHRTNLDLLVIPPVFPIMVTNKPLDTKILFVYIGIEMWTALRRCSLPCRWERTP